MTEVVALAKNLRVSAKKVRPIARNLTGKNALEAIGILRFVPKKGSIPLSKAIKSAIANAKQNDKLKEESLSIKEILVDEGPTLKRFRPVSRGSAHPILKRTSQIKVVLEDKS
jgi:large subunit ribosomal protein L22